MNNIIHRTLTAFLCMALFIIFPLSVYSEEAKAPQKDQETRAAVMTILDGLKDEAVSYFQPVSGRITSVDGKTVRTDGGSRRGIKPGMRLFVYKEGVNFIHPVTKEPLGKMEVPVGNIDITSVTPEACSGEIVSGNPADFTGAKVKIPEKKVRALFYQGEMDWYLGDAYFRALKGSGRFELVDTALKTDNVSMIIADARDKGTDLAVVLSAAVVSGNIELTEKLFRSSDGRLFSQKTVSVTPALVKGLRFGSRMLGTQSGDILLNFRLPGDIRHMVVGDVNGDGQKEVVFSAGNYLMLYSVGIDLKKLDEFKLPVSGDILWLDAAARIGASGDLILVTYMMNNEISSVIYGYNASNGRYEALWQGEGIFLRALDNGIIGQRFNRLAGFDGGVFHLVFEKGAYREGKRLGLPAGVNIYDFQYFTVQDGSRTFIAWDENGKINLYNDEGIKVWSGRDNYGGSISVFNDGMESASGLDRKQWSFKDRLIPNSGEVLTVKRTPLFDNVKGFGYRSSSIVALMSTGGSVEVRDYIDRVGGEIYDLAVDGDRVLVISKAMFGFDLRRLLKGVNPFGVSLDIFSTKGK